MPNKSTTSEASNLKSATPHSNDAKTAAAETNAERRKALAVWAKASEKRERFNAMLDLATMDLPILPAEMDRDPWVFNCTNGTIDLKTGRLRPHRKEDFITKLCPVAFDPECIACVQEGAEKAGFSRRDIVSGPGHDAAYIARIAPTTMIFVPCKDGISHNELESTTLEECAAGAQVLLNAVLA